jgi:hypothetical protein
MEHKLSKAQIEAKAYVENHNLEKVIGDMLNSLVYSKDPYPTVFMIKYLASLVSADELLEHGISISSSNGKIDAEPEPRVFKDVLPDIDKISDTDKKDDIDKHKKINPDIPEIEQKPEPKIIKIRPQIPKTRNSQINKRRPPI